MPIIMRNKTEEATTEQPVAPTATVSTENEATKEAEATIKNETPEEAEATTEPETPKNETPEEAGTTNETETPKEEAAKKGDEDVTSETKRDNSSGETADISSGEEKTSQQPVSTEEAIREVQNKIAKLKETREQNLNVPSIVSAVDNEIKDLEIMLSELNKKTSQQPVEPFANITPPNNCGVDNKLPVSTEEAIREVQNKIANLKETREQNLNVPSIVSAVDNEIKDLEIMLSELNKKIIKTQQNAAKKEVNSNMSNVDNIAITHKSILNAQIVKTLLNSQSSEPLSVTEETCQLMYDGRELSRTHNNFISACSRLLPNFSMESYKGNHVLINNETFSIYRIQRETLNIINNGIINIYNDNNERVLNDIEIEFIRATSEGAIEIHKEVDVHGNISEYALRRNINR